MARWLLLAAVMLAPLARARAKGCVGAGGVLPAGAYQRPFESAMAGLARCPAPAAAVLLGVFDEGEAAAQLRALDGDARLALGYPWAVSAARVGEATAGVALLAGTFASVEAAQAWLDGLARRGVEDPRSITALPAPLAGARVVALRDGGARADALVVQLDAAADAYRAADVRGLALPWGWEPGTLPAKLRGALAARAPACRVARGDVFVLPRASLDAVAADGVSARAWAPVRCGAEVAFVAWTATRLESVVWRSGGGHRLTQVTLVECDTPSFSQWRYRRTGRDGHARRDPSGGCR